MTEDVTSTVLYKKTLGCLLGGLIGDATGTPTEGKHYTFIEENFGWVDDFSCDGTDDTLMKALLNSENNTFRTQNTIGVNNITLSHPFILF